MTTTGLSYTPLPLCAMLFLVQLLHVSALPRLAAADDENEPKAKLDFFADVPDFHDLHLRLTEDQLKGIAAENSLDLRIAESEKETTYVLLNRKGECAIVMFRDGSCSGVQRMRHVHPVPSGDGVVRISIAADGSITSESRMFESARAVREFLERTVPETQRSKTTVEIRANPDAKHERLIEVVDSVSAVGIAKVSFIVIEDEDDPAAATRVPDDWFIPAPFPEFGFAQVGEDYMNYVRIACHAKMMDDLETTDMQRDALRRLHEELNTSLRALVTDLSDEERRRRADELQTERLKLWDNTRELVRATLTKRQQRRMAQIEFQRHGHAVFFYPELAPELELTEEQVKELRSKHSEHSARCKDGANGRESYKQFWGDVFHIMSDEQRKALDELRGPPVGKNKATPSRRAFRAPASGR